MRHAGASPKRFDGIDCLHYLTSRRPNEVTAGPADGLKGLVESKTPRAEYKGTGSEC